MAIFASPDPEGITVRREAFGRDAGFLAGGVAWLLLVAGTPLGANAFTSSVFLVMYLVYAFVVIRQARQMSRARRPSSQNEGTARDDDEQTELPLNNNSRGGDESDEYRGNPFASDVMSGRSKNKKKKRVEEENDDDDDEMVMRKFRRADDENDTTEAEISRHLPSPIEENSILENHFAAFTTPPSSQSPSPVATPTPPKLSSPLPPHASRESNVLETSAVLEEIRKRGGRQTRRVHRQRQPLDVPRALSDFPPARGVTRNERCPPPEPAGWSKGARRFVPSPLHAILLLRGGDPDNG